MSTPAGARQNRRDPSDEPIATLVQDVGRDLALLIRQEVELAKAETRQSAKKVAMGAGMLGGSGVAGTMAALFASLALWWALSGPLGRGWSALLVAAIWLVIAAGMALLGRHEVAQAGGLPQTAATARQIPEALAGKDTVTR